MVDQAAPTSANRGRCPSRARPRMHFTAPDPNHCRRRPADVDRKEYQWARIARLTSSWRNGCSKSGFSLPGSVTTPGMVEGLYRNRETLRIRCSPNEMTDSCRKTGLRYSGKCLIVARLDSRPCTRTSCKWDYLNDYDLLCATNTNRVHTAVPQQESA